MEEFLAIDPPECRRHDDALRVERAGNGWIVQVAIVDMRRKIGAHSLLFRQLRARALDGWESIPGLSLHGPEVRKDLGLRDGVQNDVILATGTLDADGRLVHVDIAEAMQVVRNHVFDALEGEVRIDCAGAVANE